MGGAGLSLKMTMGAKKKKKKEKEKGLLGDEHRLCLKKLLPKRRLKTIALVTAAAGM